ncbi:hypothetical protein KW801_03775 [Candidatus Saccharibacteria bacterium]|nr:hypothetical protein [Candidatus Saccharibacteria bacterium]
MRRNNQVFEGGEWYLFAGCTLVGLGLGMALSSAGAGLVIGAGVGFLAMVAASAFQR